MNTTARERRRRNCLPRAIALVVMLVISHSIAFAQATSTSQKPAQGASPTSATLGTAAEAQTRLSLAMSNPNYPVTPGDVYLLSYYQTPSNHISTDVMVNGNWGINLGVFGTLDARDLTFTQLKQRVERLIADSYRQSLPSLRIVTPGIFEVAVKGEVNQVQNVTAWGMTKLSTVFDKAKDHYSSLRRVEVRSRAGGVKGYDLFKALRLGDGSQNPYVKPGDTVILFDRGRTVTLSGEVRHPGTYELLPAEGLRDLIEQFGGGTTAKANPNRILIERNLAAQPHVDYVSIPQAYDSGVKLFDGDTVVVTSRAERQSVIWIEGAVSPPTSGGVEPARAQAQAGTQSGPITASAGTARPTLNRFALKIWKGEMLSDALAEVRNSISPTANLADAVLLQAGQSSPTTVNLTQLIAHPGSPDDILLSPNDTIFLPSLPSTVSVFGAVMAPGFFPYVPGQPATYYISQAGGVNPESNSGGVYSVTAANGKTQSPTDAIRPGDRVYVPLNSFGYRLRRNVPTMVAIISVILSTATFIYFNVIH